MDLCTLEEIDRLPADTALTVGIFDGVHLGHQAIFHEVRSLADRHGHAAAALTFDPHPAEVAAPDKRPPLITTFPQRAELLSALGLDVLVVAHDLRSLFALEPEAFVEQVIAGKLLAREIVVGGDWTFGRGRRGTVPMLRERGPRHGVAVTEVPWFTVGAERVSSTAIRRMLRAGDVERAETFLGRRHFAEGLVVRGAGRGAELGVPTANLQTVNELLPASGVYAGRARFEGRWYTAAVFVGPPLTFGDTRPAFEVHLIDFPGRDIQGAPVRVEFARRLRDNRAFDTPADLASQMRSDIDEARGVAEAVDPGH